MKLDNVTATKYGTLALVGFVGAVVVYYAAKQFAGIAAGIATGDNALTRNQTDAEGNSTDAYVNKGVVGTVAAGANSVSGGVFASIGSKLGEWAFEAFGPKVDINAPVGTSGPMIPTRNVDIPNIDMGKTGEW